MYRKCLASRRILLIKIASLLHEKPPKVEENAFRSCNRTAEVGGSIPAQLHQPPALKTNDFSNVTVWGAVWVETGQSHRPDQETNGRARTLRPRVYQPFSVARMLPRASTVIRNR